MLATLEHQGALFAPPTDRPAIEMVSTMLTSNHLAAIPPEYSMLLEKANGIVYNGYEFLGTKKFTYKDEFSIPGLLDAGVDVNSSGTISGKLLVARGQIELFLYDERSSSYEVVDRMTLSFITQHPNLASLLSSVIMS
jgi:hypothetical protein